MEQRSNYLSSGRRIRNAGCLRSSSNLVREARNVRSQTVPESQLYNRLGRYIRRGHDLHYVSRRVLSPDM